MTPFSGYYVGRDRVLERARQRRATEDAGPASPITGSSSRWSSSRTTAAPPWAASACSSPAPARRLARPATSSAPRSGAACITTSTCSRTASGASGSSRSTSPTSIRSAWKDGVWAKSKDPLPRPRAGVQRWQLSARHSADGARQARGTLPRRHRRDQGVADDPADVVPVHQPGERPRARALSGTACPARCVPNCGSKPMAIRSRRTRQPRTGRPDERPPSRDDPQGAAFELLQDARAGTRRTSNHITQVESVPSQHRNPRALAEWPRARTLPIGGRGACSRMRPSGLRNVTAPKPVFQPFCSSNCRTRTSSS